MCDALQNICIKCTDTEKVTNIITPSKCISLEALSNFPLLLFVQDVVNK